MEICEIKGYNLKKWMKNNKKNKKETPFRTTFIFGASQSELSIKSYGCLKLFHPKFLKP